MKLLAYLYGLVCMSVLLACQRENISNDNIASESLCFNISVNGIMNQYNVTSRGTDVKTTEEQEIKSLYVFIFDKDGNYLEQADGHRYQGYRSFTNGQTVMNIDRYGWKELDKAKEATVIVVANVEDGTFKGGAEGVPPTNVPNRQTLETFVYKPLIQRNITSIPNSGMPMYKRLDNVDLTTSNSNQSIEIPMKALMARVDVSLEINSSNTDLSGTLPSFTVTQCQVINVPLSTKLELDESQETDLSSLGKDDFDIPTSALETIYNKNGKLEFTFYTFENLQDPARTEPVDGWPNGIQPDEKQKYKPLLADKDNSLLFQFGGKYITYNGASYDVTYDLYLGANHTDDFKIGRNKQYKNNVTITGIANALNSPSQITLDARVNIKTSNPYFVSILKDRTLDCHFNVIPMDIYFYNDGLPSGVKQTMKVEILNPSDAYWVRMEKVTAEQMENGEAPNTECIATNQAWQSGNGKRKYFTTDLVTSTLSPNIEMPIDNSRDRIYFYVDENLDIWHLGDSRDERTRTATVKLTYYEDGVEKGTRELVLEQSKLLEVTFHSDEESGFSNKVIYIEAYEEYLSHGDPLNEYENNQVYTGLPWEDYSGGSGTTIGRLGGLRTPYCSENYFWGYEFTPKIVNAAEYDVRDITLNSKPKTAAGYCYVKNKRNSDGSVPNYKWYLPGIRELERILEDYYLDYTELQNNYYWSSAAGEGSVFNKYENSNYARATKAYIGTDGKFHYYESGSSYEYDGEQGEGGFTPRKTTLRIRAARKDNLSQ